MTEALAALDTGTYKEPCKMSLSQWLDIWTSDYMGSLKPRTVELYKSQIKNHIKPALGAVRLEALNTHVIQQFYNRAGETLSPKSVKNIHGILHRGISQAVAIGYLQHNPADACTLPRVERKEIKPLDESMAGHFLEAIKGHRQEILFTVALFTGMRQSEIIGLEWRCVDFDKGCITIDKQLQKVPGGGNEYHLVTTKNSKGRKITPAPFIMALLRRQRVTQAEWRLKAGAVWEDTGLVFTNEAGGHLTHRTVHKDFKKVAAQIGIPETRFHDLRHSYAVAALRSGDDVKTVQGNLGHATASFTLDIYGHVTDQMKQESARRMEGYIKTVMGL